MPTLAEVIENVRYRLSGVGAVTDGVTELAASLTPTGTTVHVVDATGMGPGVYEVGLEKIRVRSVDQASSRLTAWSFGRGYGQTKPSAHPAGSEVTINPTWSAAAVATEINGVLRELYPALFAVKTLEGPNAYPFTLPVDATAVVGVFRQAGSTWERLDDWRFEPGADHALFIPYVPADGRVRVQYATEPGIFDLAAANVLAQDYETVTGLPARTADLLTLGVGYRLAPMVDLARLAQKGAEAKADQRDQSAGASLSRLLLAEFTQRLQGEQLALHREYPIRIHKER